MDLKEEAAIGSQIDIHWYYVSKARMLATHIARLMPGRKALHVMDVGAGAGWFSKWLLRNDLAARATCIDPGYEIEREEKIEGRPLAFRRSATAADSADVDLVLMMDVLEHVDDDAALLSDYLSVVQNGVPVFVTVPAFQFLWSTHDVFLEHRRRYSLSLLEDTITRAGGDATDMHYYFGAIFPLAATVRLMQRGGDATSSDMKPAPTIVNAALKAVCSAERSVMRLNRLAGLSAVGICRR